MHLANSLVWEAITGEPPPLPPPTAKTYTDQSLPWFDYYAEGRHALDGAETLKRLTSVLEMGHQQGDTPLPENAPVAPDRVIRYRGRPSKRQVRDGAYCRPPRRAALLHESELARTDPGPQFLHRPMRCDIGLPSPVI